MKPVTQKLFWRLLALIYLVTRLVNLQAMPAFTDELMYGHWIRQVHASFSQYAGVSLSDGQQPGFFWLASLLLPLLNDPVLSLRLLAVLSGLVTLVLLFLLGTQLFTERVGFFVGGLYVLSPFFLLYDRLGIKDSLLALAAVGVCYSSVMVVRKNEWRWAFWLAVFVALGLMTKSTSYFFLPLTFTALCLGKKSGWSKSLLLLIVGLLGGVALQSVQWFASPGLSVAAKNRTFLLSLVEVKQLPWLIWKYNLLSTLGWLGVYVTWPILMVAVWGWMRLHDWARKLFVLTWIGAPLLVEIGLAKIYFPRYFLFVTLFVLLLAAWGLDRLVSKWSWKWSFLAVGILVLPSTILSWNIVADITQARITDIDRWQYLEGWPSGYGMKEMVEYVRGLGKTTVYVEDTTLLTEGIPYYLGEGVSVEPVFTVGEDLDVGLAMVKDPESSVFIFNHRQVFPDEWNYRLGAKFDKVRERESIKVFVSK